MFEYAGSTVYGISVAGGKKVRFVDVLDLIPYSVILVLRTVRRLSGACHYY